MKRRDDSLIRQVVAANLLLLTLVLLAAATASRLDLSNPRERWQFMVLALAVGLTMCVNVWILKRRFEPLTRLIEAVERVDPAAPDAFDPGDDPVAEIDRLKKSFRRLLHEVEAERRRGGQLVVRAQEEERRRVARDLHDEVNQSLTAILLRLEALAQDPPPGRVEEIAELKRLVNRAMDELLSLARQLRPTALDDHGLVPAMDTQLRRFSSATGVWTRFDHRGDPGGLDPERQNALFRIAQEALANIGRHAEASRVDVDLAVADGVAELLVRDDGGGFDPGALAATGAGLGLRGMAERARLAGGKLEITSSRGGGTLVKLRLGAR
jgi:two-component system sensor histidine kinase UhpB